MSFQITPLDPRGDEAMSFWDTTFGFFPDDAHGDWAVAAADDRTAPGGLRSAAPIETAIALCLLTDARARAHDDLPSFVEDRRGWWGDQVDVEETRGEGDLGSRLWTLQWARLNEDTVERAEALAREALAPLIARRVCQRIDVRAEALAGENRIDLDVRAYGATGNRTIARRFALIWERQGGIPAPLAR